MATEARENATLRAMAEVALDAADSTREPPNEGRQEMLDRLANGGGL